MFGFGAGTMRFDGVQSTQTVDIGGVVLTDATFNFTRRKISWNFAKHPRTGEWGLIDPVIYQETTLEDLFA